VPQDERVFYRVMALDLGSQVAILRQTVAMLSPGERAISREQAFVILERLDQVEAQLEYLRHGLRQLLADVDDVQGPHQ
jgi:hypothetical protein